MICRQAPGPDADCRDMLLVTVVAVSAAIAQFTVSVADQGQLVVAARRRFQL